MPDYSQACIYKIKHNEDYNDENIYIGSTCNLIRRRCEHKNKCKDNNSKEYGLKIHQYIRDNGGWDNFIVIKVHDFPCNSKSELQIEERRMIDLLHSKLNKQMPTRTHKQWCKDNSTYLKEKEKQTITCECGCEVVRHKLGRHQRTNKHQKLMNLKTSLNPQK